MAPRNWRPTAYCRGLQSGASALRCSSRSEAIGGTSGGRTWPLDGYISHFQVKTDVEVARLSDKGGGFGLRASCEILPCQPFISLPRRAVLEVGHTDVCPWNPEDLEAGVHCLEAEQVWRSLPIYLRLALKLINASAFTTDPNVATDHADAEILREYFDMLPRNHTGALAWSHAELLELQVPTTRACWSEAFSRCSLVD